jgi:tetratricopeptide (TPR) repeat protein
VSLRLYNISAGEFFDLIRPIVNIISALISTWVLASARKRFPLYLSLAWAAGSLFLPLVVVPIYLIVVITGRQQIQTPIKYRLALPVLYGVAVVAVSGVMFYLENRSVDAHLRRAIQAKLNNDYLTAGNEYRQALTLNDDAHVHKLLGLTLIDAGNFTDAISELRLAEKGGEPDDLIPYYLAWSLERINQNGQASLEYEKFLLTPTCARPEPRCDSVRQRHDVLRVR